MSHFQNRPVSDRSAASDRDGRRVVRLGDLLAWMRNVQSVPALAAE
jgi:hypothetical protein